MANLPPSPEFIKSLEPNSPIDSNFVYGADDWLRFVQQVLDNQFPTSEDDTANGWDIALTVKASEVNSLLGITGVVESRLDALEADAATLPGGGVTAMAFWQAAAPTGWTQIVTEDDAMLRVVSTAGGGNGGSDSPISMAGTDVPQHTHTLTISTENAHTHGAYRKTGSAGQNRTVIQEIALDTNSADTFDAITSNGSTIYILNSAGAHNHGGSTADANSGPTAWEPKYADMILATKD